jgi:hypothetical protein
MRQMIKYVITIESEFWKKFRQTIAKHRTINQVIVKMIMLRVRKRNPKGVERGLVWSKPV